MSYDDTHTKANKARPKLPDYLSKYQQSPEEILGGRVLPPARPPNGANPLKNHPDVINLAQLAMPNMPSTRATRPSKYNSPAELQYAIDLYFDRVDATRGTPEFEEPTVPGLAYALGFASRQTLRDYKKDDANEDFQFVITRAITRLEAISNQKILKGGPATPGTIFNLKNNHGYADKTEQTTTHKVGGTLEAMLEAMQGRVLRPMLPTLPDTQDYRHPEIIDVTPTQQPQQTQSQQDDEELW